MTQKILIAVLYFTLITTNLSSQTTKKIQEEDVKYWVEYLASDNMRGRANGSQELLQTAVWLSAKFESFGLLAPKKHPIYVQDYTFTDYSGKLISERNIIGIIEGSDPKLKKECIVLSAHMDHIGIGEPIGGDSIYNGANDNASGVSAVLGIAKYIKDNQIKVGRTLVFVTFSAEEIGMHGSKYYVNNPVIPLKKTYLNINFELLGHCSLLGEKKFYFTGEELSNLEVLVKEFSSDRDWQFVAGIGKNNWMTFASDNASFLKAKREKTHFHGVPAHTFVIHKGENHLHKPWDEADGFNFNNLTGFINNTAELVVYLSWSEEKITLGTEKYQMLK